MIKKKINPGENCLEIESSQLPLYIVYKGKDETKEYVLKDNKKQSGILLNKREY